jgi:hypothetical protein
MIRLRCFADDMNGLLLASAFLLAFAPRAYAQTEPRPAPPIPDSKGLLTRAAFLVSVAGMETADPRFSLVERSRADVDLAAYRRGRINFFIDTELIMGSERRAIDLNQANIIFETSASYRIGLFNIAGVVHHVSRHVVDREFDRVPAWHTIGPRIERTIVTPNTTIDFIADYGYVVQHTFVDYTWTSQLTLRVDRTVRRRAHLFASGRTGWVGVDRPVLGRTPQNGGRVEAGVHLPGQRALFDLFAAHERRVDGYPTSREPSSWLEFGFRLVTR